MLVLVLVACLMPCLLAITLDDLIEDPSWVSINATALNRRFAPNGNDIDFPEILYDNFLRIVEKQTMHRDLVTIRNRTDDGPIDCFGFTPMLASAFQWSFKPSKIKDIAVKFYLSSREHRKRSQYSEKLGRFKPIDFKIGHNLVLIIHGFMSNSDMTWVHNLTNSLLDKMDVNVVAVDWGGGSLSWKYWTAVGNTKVVGAQTSQFLRRLLKKKLTAEQIHCIGHSLGAHICSYAARHVGTFGRISGLDPAQPCFNGRGLSASDALYIDVVHTNTNLFGRYETLGTHDFYPNGGKMQPGCKLRDSSFFGQFLSVRRTLEEAVCSHGRSYEYYIDSLTTDGCKFWGRLWDFTKKHALALSKEPCSRSTCSPMGLDSVFYPGRGAYYFPTFKRTPFCIPDSNDGKRKKLSTWVKALRRFHKLSRNTI